MKKINTLAFIALMFMILTANSGLAIAAIADDSLSITIICDMRDTTDLQSYDPSTMYLTGSWTPPTEPGLTDWTFFTLDSIAQHIFRVTFKYAPGQFAGNEADDPDLLADCPAWYFAPTDDWSTAENVPAPCNVAWDIQRIFYINLDDPDTIVAFKYGVCEPEPLTDLGLPEYSGIDEVQDQNLLIYPNPSDGLIYVDCSSFSSNTLIDVMDISGRRVKRIENATGIAVIDVTGMPPSIYLVKVSDGENSAFKKIVLR
jgi:hypothetical protein